jgi:hypothetical protein
MGRKYTQEEIQDLTDRIYLLRSRLEDGKIHFAPHLIDGFMKSYQAIRIGEDGLVDPETVDGRMRAATLAIRAMSQRQEAKEQLSVGDIQEAYFKILAANFGWILDKMRESQVTPEVAGRAMASDSSYVEHVVSKFPEFYEDIKQFWTDVSETGYIHLQDGRQLKTVFGGDIFPSHRENVVSTAGLYVDTIVLPCPVMRLGPLINISQDQEFVSMLVKHVLTALTYRDLATADINPPLVLILPSYDDFELDSAHATMERSKPSTLLHASYLFGRKFESIEEFAEFCTAQKTIDQVVKELKGADRLLFDIEYGTDPRAQLSREMAAKHPMPIEFDPEIAGNHVLFACMGRMPQALTAQDKAMNVGGTPMIAAETSWRYYTWLLDYQASPTRDDITHRESMHVVRAVQSQGSNDLEWLGNVPPETVLEIRKRGYAEDIRSILSNGIRDLITLNPDNYFRTSDQVVSNLQEAFDAHLRSLRNAREKN